MSACGHKAPPGLAFAVHSTTGNVVEALSAASKLEHVGLAEALELLLLILDGVSGKFERAVLRWHARLCTDVWDMQLGESIAVLALLEQLQETSRRGCSRARGSPLPAGA